MNPWESVPDEWLSLHATEKLIAERFHCDPLDVVNELVAALRRSRLDNRVIELSAISSPTLPSLPPGIAIKAFRGEIIISVRDWLIAEVDWQFGTVGGWADASGSRHRHLVELWWPTVERWFPNTDSALRASIRQSGPTHGITKPSHSPSPAGPVRNLVRGKGSNLAEGSAGRERKHGHTTYPWSSFETEALRILEEKGAFDPVVEPGWYPAKLEQLMTEWCERSWGKGPGETSIKKHVRIAVKKHSDARKGI